MDALGELRILDDDDDDVGCLFSRLVGRLVRYKAVRWNTSFFGCIVNTNSVELDNKI